MRQREAAEAGALRRRVPPAQIFGVADKVGTLEVGKMANLVVTDGDVLEARTNTMYVFIDDCLVLLDSRQTVLGQTHKNGRWKVEGGRRKGRLAPTSRRAGPLRSWKPSDPTLVT